MRKRVGSVKDMSERLAAAVLAVVKQHMKVKGMSKYGLAQATGLKQSSVYRWLDDKNPQDIGLDELAKIAKALGTTAVAIMGEAEPRTR